MTTDNRKSTRQQSNLIVLRQSGLEDSMCTACDISPTGIRIKRHKSRFEATPVCNLELHIVPDAITTVIAGRTVWQNSEFEGFEFISPSFAQQMMLEKLAGNL